MNNKERLTTIQFKAPDFLVQKLKGIMKNSDSELEDVINEMLALYFWAIEELEAGRVVGSWARLDGKGYNPEREITADDIDLVSDSQIIITPLLKRMFNRR